MLHDGLVVSPLFKSENVAYKADNKKRDGDEKHTTSERKRPRRPTGTDHRLDGELLNMPHGEGGVACQVRSKSKHILHSSSPRGASGKYAPRNSSVD